MRHLRFRFTARPFWAALFIFALGFGQAEAEAQSVSAAPKAELVQDFAKARALRANGAYGQAIEKLRALLRKVPGDTGVREELGYSLLLDGQYAAAQYHFQILAERAPSAQKRQLYRAVLNRILSERPFGVSFVLALVPSSNVNSGAQGSDIDTVFGLIPIDEGSRAQAGWRATFGLSGYARTSLGPSDKLVFNWRALRTEYDTSAADATTELGVSLTWEHLTDRGGYFLSFGQSQEKSDTERLRRAVVQVGGIYKTSATRQFEWSLSHTDKRFRSGVGRNGADIVGTVRHKWLLAGAQSVFVGLVLEDGDPELRHQQYHGQILQIGGQKRLRNGLVFDGLLSFGRRDFAEAAQTLLDARKDYFTEITLSAQDSRITWQGFTPRATCKARFNRSNIALYQATTHECGLELTRRF